MINWGVIGAGRIAHRFCESLANDKRANLEAVSCRTMQKAKEFQKQHPCHKIYDDYQQLLDDPKIDAVYISLPHFYHYEWVKKAIMANKSVLVEKPACMNVAQTKEIVELAKSKNVLLMEAMKARFVPGYQEAKKLIVSGILGKITKIETSFCGKVEYDENSYLFDRKQGGCLLDLGIYNIALIQDYFGDGFSDLKVECKYHDCGVDEYVNATLNYNDKIGIVKCAMDHSEPIQAIVHGEHGVMTISPMHRPSDINISMNDGNTINKHYDYHYDDFYSEIAHFNDLILENNHESSIMSFGDSIKCAKILEAILEMM